MYTLKKTLFWTFEKLSYNLHEKNNGLISKGWKRCIIQSRTTPANHLNSLLSQILRG